MYNDLSISGVILGIVGIYCSLVVTGFLMTICEKERTTLWRKEWKMWFTWWWVWGQKDKDLRRYK